MQAKTASEKSALFYRTSRCHILQFCSSRPHKTTLQFSIKSQNTRSLRMLLLHHVACILSCLLCIFNLRVFYTF